MLVTMNEVLLPAKEGKYGVGFFNAVNVEMARAIIETAEELRAPVMVGTAEVLLPAMPLERVAEYLIPMAQKASVPVCVHYDHGLSFEKCMEALRLGFTSIMYDCSTEDYGTNITKVAEMVRICHGMGVTVEGELGHVGDNEGAGRLLNPSDYYTDPSAAEDYLLRTGVRDEIESIPSIGESVTRRFADAGRPLVLHGGSGLSDADFRTAVQKGICKVNIFTDLDKAGKAGVEKGLSEGAKTMMGLIPYEIEAMKTVVRDKLKLFGSVGRA